MFLLVTFTSNKTSFLRSNFLSYVLCNFLFDFTTVKILFLFCICYFFNNSVKNTHFYNKIDDVEKVTYVQVDVFKKEKLI